MFKSEQLCELWEEDKAFYRVLLQRREREISKNAGKKKKKSEGTGYQGHMDEKKLKIALRERKHSCK